MAFRTNKVPAIEERTVSGSSVSFNSAFALPLKACKVSFSATQAGSGDPSPSNPRAISGVSAIGLNANSTPVSVSLGDTRYGGELDVLTGIMTLTDVAYKIKDLAFSYYSAYGRFVTSDYVGSRLAPKNNDTIAEGLMCECYISGRASSGSGTKYPDKRIAVAAVSSYLFIYDSSYTDVNTMKSAVGDYYVKWRLKESSYITIQLSANELSSIIGNNTFSTDTGTLEITFADLQEKSASGSVASFNTALAMPLASCNIAVNAWQEGSGDPSPSNVRPIHGFSEVNATRAGKNLIDVSKNIIGAYINSIGGETTAGAQSWAISDYIPVAKGGVYTFNPNSTEGISAKGAFYDENKQYLPNSIFNSGAITITVPTNAFYVRFSMRTTSYDVQLEAGSTATDYEPYVTPTIYTKSLGETVYGGSYNSVTGDKRKTWICKKIKDLRAFNYVAPSASYPYGYVSMTADEKKPNHGNIICECFRTINGFSYNNAIMGTSSNRIVYVVTDTISSKEEFLSTYGEYMVMFELLTPIESNIGATPISTNIGNNTIFADTGDIDLTYKDLDIAKRGSFREVFKLPS